MDLCQEYYSRHNITEPCIKFAKNGTFFLRNAEGDHIKWKLYCISYVRHSVYPSKYKVKQLRPLSNRDDYLFERVGTETSLEWDEYEDFFLELANRISNKDLDYDYSVIENQTDIFLTAWEMFVYSMEKKLIKYIQDDDFVASIDIDLPSNIRYIAYRNFIDKNAKDEELKNKRSFFYPWHHTMMDHIRKYCHWFPAMVNSKKILI